MQEGQCKSAEGELLCHYRDASVEVDIAQSIKARGSLDIHQLRGTSNLLFTRSVNERTVVVNIETRASSVPYATPEA